MATPGRESFGARVLERRVEKRDMRPRNAASLIAVLWLIAIVVFGVLEHLIDKETFNTVWQGMWWATQTVTTVGYGDVVPGDAAGRLIATILMVGGLSLFAVVTGAITSAFVTRAQERERAGEGAEMLARIDELAAQIESLRDDLSSRN